MSRILRQKPRINYCEIENPNVDEYVFCDDCGENVHESYHFCSKHDELGFLSRKRKRPDRTRDEVQSVSMSRSRLRPRPRISNCETGDLDRDEYVFCEYCEDDVFEYCSIHGPLLVIPDDKVPQPTGFPSFVPHAALTIPQEFLHLARSNIPITYKEVTDVGIGVFATLTLPQGVRFGPYRGQRVKEANSQYCWQISANHRVQSQHVIDAGDATSSNWMRYVNCARHWLEQNLLAYQHKGDIYYRTIKVIPRFAELLVFYGTEFAHSLRIDMKNYNSENFDTLHLDALPFEKPPNKQIEGTSNNTHETEGNHTGETENDEMSTIETIDEDTDNENTNSNQQNSHEQNKDYSNNSNIAEKNKIEDENSISECILACDICSYTTYSKRYLEPHLKAHFSEKCISCDHCPYITTKSYHFRKHYKIHTGEKSKTRSYKYSCHICNFTSNAKKLFRSHLEAHKSEKYFSCQFCPYITTKSTIIKRHYQIHKGEKHGESSNDFIKFSCHLCNFTSNAKNLFRSHLEAHKSEKYFSCRFCPYITTKSTTFKQHYQMHKGEKHGESSNDFIKFSCHLCNFTSNAKNLFRSHLEAHKSEKYFSCRFCPYITTKSTTFKRHYQMHKGEKYGVSFNDFNKFPCLICNFTTSDERHFKAHLRAHSSKNKHSCDLCPYITTDRSRLKRHIYNIHKI